MKVITDEENKTAYEALRALYSKTHSACAELTGGLVKAYIARDSNGPDFTEQVDKFVADLVKMAEEIDKMCPAKQRHNQLPPIAKEKVYETREEAEQ